MSDSIMSSSAHELKEEDDPTITHKHKSHKHKSHKHKSHKQKLHTTITPQAITPPAITPPTITPQAFASQAFTPQAFAPQAFIPQVFSRQTITPQDIIDQTQSAADRNRSRPSFRNYPIRLMISDACLIFRNFLLIFRLFESTPTSSTVNIGPVSTRRKFGSFRVGIMFEQFVLALITFIGGFLVAATSIVSGALGILTFSIILGLLSLLSNFYQRPAVVESEYQPRSKPKDEKWFFINGICTGTEGLRRDVEFIAQMFDRPITGVHNKTNGIILDLVECIIQRDFTYPLQNGTVELYNRLKEALFNKKITKVVLLAHSQGGIISSLILDSLLSDIPQVLLLKLEIYTFGNAANHFNSPITTSFFRSKGFPVVRYIEHYANGKDFVAKIGVLNWQVRASDDQDTRFYGRLFERPSATGHLLIEHYFENCFDPSHAWPKSADGQHSRLWKYLNGGSINDNIFERFIRGEI